MYVTPEVKARVQAMVEKCVRLANVHFKRTYSVPPVHYDVRGTVGGYHQHGQLHFNPVLLMENLEDYIESTVPHETAHHIDTINGDNARPNIYLSRNGRRPKRSVHGPSWQLIMRVFGVEDITRCHQYDVSNAQVKMKNKFEYKCQSCSKKFFISSVRHNRIRAGSVYTCPTCGRTRGLLVYVQSLGQRTIADAKKVSNERAARIESIIPAAAAYGFTVLKAITVTPVLPVAAVAPGTSIQDRARKIFGMYGTLGRQVCIRKMVDIGVKDTTASTYYQNFKSGK